MIHAMKKELNTERYELFYKNFDKNEFIIKDLCRTELIIVFIYRILKTFIEAKEMENYYFYLVFNTKTTSPKVWKIKKPLQYENRGLTLIPINYRVIINTKIGGNKNA